MAAHDGDSAVSPATRSGLRPSPPSPAPKQRQWWFDARGLSDAGVLDAAYQSNCFALLIDPGQGRQIMTGKQKVAWLGRGEPMDGLPADVWVLTPDESLLA